jgi:hypothetical protein
MQSLIFTGLLNPFGGIRQQQGSAMAWLPNTFQSVTNSQWHAIQAGRCLTTHSGVTELPELGAVPNCRGLHLLWTGCLHIACRLLCIDDDTHSGR